MVDDSYQKITEDKKPLNSKKKNQGWRRIILTSNKKSPGLSPAMSATPPGSTSSKYCKAGHFIDGFNCIRGDDCLAPRNIKPKPRLALCKITVRGSPTNLK